MASIAMDVPDRQVSIGRVFGRAFGTIGSNPVTTLGVAFLFSALPSTLVNLAIRQVRGTDLSQMSVATNVALTMFSALLGIAFYAIVQGALVRSTVDHEEGRHPGLGESIMAGLVVAIPLIVMAIISGIAMMIGMVLFVVPGIILYMMWSVSAPALVDERLSIMGALGRSRYLTRGYRWRIFGMVLVLVVLSWLAMALMTTLVVAGGSFSLQAMAKAQQDPSIMAIAVLLIMQTLISVVSGVSHASLFVELRNAKDGPSDEALADVFH